MHAQAGGRGGWGQGAGRDAVRPGTQIDRRELAHSLPSTHAPSQPASQLASQPCPPTYRMVMKKCSPRSSTEYSCAHRMGGAQNSMARSCQADDGLVLKLVCCRPLPLSCAMRPLLQGPPARPPTVSSVRGSTRRHSPRGSSARSHRTSEVMAEPARWGRGEGGARGARCGRVPRHQSTAGQLCLQPGQPGANGTAAHWVGGTARPPTHPHGCTAAARCGSGPARYRRSRLVECGGAREEEEGREGQSACEPPPLLAAAPCSPLLSAEHAGPPASPKPHALLTPPPSQARRTRLVEDADVLRGVGADQVAPHLVRPAGCARGKGRLP